MSQTTYKKFLKKLTVYRYRKIMIKLTKRLFMFLAIMVLLLLLFLTIEGYVYLSSDIRFYFVLLYLLMFLIIGGAFLIHPFYRLVYKTKADFVAVAKELGLFYKKVNDRLANALQLYHEHLNTSHYSKPLIEKAFDDISSELENENFNKNLNYRPIRQLAFALFFAIIIFTVVWVTSPAFYSSSFERLSHPLTNYDFDPDLDIYVKPGNLTVLNGSTLDIVITTNKPITQPTLIIRQNSNEFEHLLSTETDSFYYSLKDINEPLEYYVQWKDNFSDIYEIDVVERPVLRQLKAEIFPPKYSKIKSFKLEENIGDILALKGSTVRIAGLLNKNVKSGTLLFEKLPQKELVITDNKFSIDFRIRENDRYHFHFVDENGFENKDPIAYQIRVLTDKNPVVGIPIPGKDVDLPEDNILPLTIIAEDDYGFSKLQLAYQVVYQEQQVDSAGFEYLDIPVSLNSHKKILVNFPFDVSQLDLLPTDAVVYYAAVFDNDAITGPKKATSKWYRAIFPSLYDMYEDMNNHQDGAIEELKEIMAQGEMLQQKVDEMTLELRRDKNLDWQQQQELNDIVSQREDIQNKLDNVSDTLEEMLLALDEKRVLSDETMDKYEQMQNLVNDIMTPKLDEAFKKMQDAMENLDPNQVQKALEEMDLSDDAMQQQLDRTISLLEKMKLEQQLEQANQLAQNISDRQKSITENINKPNSDNQRMSAEQQNIQDSVNDLNQLLSDLSQNLGDDATQQIAKENVQQAQQKLSSENVYGEMGQLSQNMMQNDMDGASQQSQQMQNTMDDITKQLQQAHDAMSGAMAQKAMREMQRNMVQLLELSHQQEGLMNTTQQTFRNNPELLDMAEQQDQIKSGLNRISKQLFELSKQNLALSPTTAAALGKAMQEMDNSLKSLEERDNYRASQSQGQAMTALNEAVRQLNQNMQNMMQGGQGQGSPSYQQFMKQMQQMAQGQQSLNQQTMSGLGQNAAMQRLAQQQQALRKAMQQLAQEAQQMSDLLGDMDKIAEDMESVEKDMFNQNVDQRTTNRQQRILSRMLDAQKSMQQREYSKKREAETGRDYFSKSPNQLQLDLGQQENQLQRDVLRAQEEGYSRDYLELIEEYFNALTKYDANN